MFWLYLLTPSTIGYDSLSNGNGHMYRTHIGLGCMVEDDWLDYEANEAKYYRKKRKGRKKRMQRSRIQSSSFSSLWLCFVVLLCIVSRTVVEAVCAPSNNADLKLAVNACILETADGSCPTFALASNSNGCNGGGVNGFIGLWDVSQVTSMDNVFLEAAFFNANISNWDVSSATTMFQSGSLSLSSLFCCLLL